MEKLWRIDVYNMFFLNILIAVNNEAAAI